ncbi:small subunit ribosomal protein S6 [Acetoanaerobium pronyense]|uniref:Small ribosomal subunit protein bS6 n=1 Tax=Acetoanaerobium pronyense TaxID=1482736 RepID=A0ABS4KN25_9FIRM|nr:30S ribosomal protein S6 [Acetoanaerobium pronyense]MBP2028546.1 small subunit ribosomal protein S6 [Acetoanaerobium pronyense]
MRKYELIYVLRPNLEDEAKAVVLDKVKSIIEADGEVEKVDEWGNRRLAYEIEKLTEGYYVLINFKAATDVPKEIDRNLKIMDNVIRHMIVNIDDK